MEVGETIRLPSREGRGKADTDFKLNVIPRPATSQEL